MMREDRDNQQREPELGREDLSSSEPLLVAYGSLVAQASLEHSLGHPVDCPQICLIPGWRRAWTSAYADSGWAALDAAGRLFHPRRWHYLDLEPAAESTLTAAVYRLSEKDLARLDRREIGYDRVRIGADERQRSFWAYRSQAAHRAPLPEKVQDGAVARSYLDLVRRGHRELGIESSQLADLSPCDAMVVEDRPIPSLRGEQDGCATGTAE